MQTHEEKKARMRAYYQANKDKWKKYNRDKLTRMTDTARATSRKKQREYYRKYYDAHRTEVIERTSKYQREHKDELSSYRAAWYQSNKPKIASQRRRYYHSTIKPRQKDAKDNSKFVTLSEAVRILGAKLRAFRRWVYDGRIRSVKTPGGRYLLYRADLDEIQTNIKHIPEQIRASLGLSSKGGNA